MNKKLIVAILVLLFLTGCGDRTVRNNTISTLTMFNANAECGDGKLIGWTNGPICVYDNE